MFSCEFWEVFQITYLKNICETAASKFCTDRFTLSQHCRCYGSVSELAFILLSKYSILSN